MYSFSRFIIPCRVEGWVDLLIAARVCRCATTSSAWFECETRWDWEEMNRVVFSLYLIGFAHLYEIWWCTLLYHWPSHTHNHFMALFPGPPGWASAKRELLDFMVQGKINRGGHTDHLPGHNSVRTNQFPPPPSSPLFFAGRMPFLPPIELCQSTEGLAHSD